MSRYLAVGDLHLGAGPDYGREPGERLDEQRNVWHRICRTAVERKVDGVLFAGDAFERRRPTPPEIVIFREGLELLGDEGIGVVAVTGNHDVVTAEIANALDTARASGYYDPFSRPGISYAFEGAAVACLPWTPVARLVAANGGGDRDELHDRAADLLVESARGLRAEIAEYGDDSRAAILLLHWSVSGSSLPSGLPVDQLREPVLPLEELEAMGWDAVVAGHIHAPQLIRGGADDPVVTGSGQRSRLTPCAAPILYVGSPLPLNFGESSCDHGVWLLDVGVGASSAEFLPIQSRPFVTLDLDRPPNDETTFEFDRERIDGAIVKLRYKATVEQARRVDHAQLRQALIDAGAHKVFIEATVERQARARAEGVDEGLDEMAALDRYLTANAILGDHADRIRERMSRYLEEARA